MTARRGFATLVSATMLALGAAAVPAQAYPTLHVIALSQRVDRGWVEPGGVFHVTIHVKIAQRRDRLDELILGSFDDCEIISNETIRTALPDGTDFVERLAVQALAPGAATISPAYIDALDPSIGKPMRFSSNAVRVEVRGAALAAAPHATFSLRRLVLAATIVAGLFAAAFVLYVLFVRRRRVPAKAPAAPVAVVTTPPPAPLPAPGERLSRAAHAFRTERAPATLMALRAVLFELAGVGAGATLVDALRATGGRDAHLRAALLAAEDAAFGPAADRAAAGDALLAAVAAYIGEAPASRDAWTR